jgi:hypothetical protein
MMHIQLFLLMSNALGPSFDEYTKGSSLRLRLTYARVVARISVADRTSHHARWKLQRSRSPEHAFVVADQKAPIRTILLEGDQVSLLSHASGPGKHGAAAAEPVFAR